MNTPTHSRARFATGFIALSLACSPSNAETYRIHGINADEGVALYKTEKWILVDGKKYIDQIKKRVPLNHDLLVDKGTIGGGYGFAAYLVLGGNKLTVTGGHLKGARKDSGHAGIQGNVRIGGARSQLVASGGHVEVSHLADISAELSGDAKVTLFRGSAPLENCVIELDPKWSGTVSLERRLPDVVRSDDLRKFTVGGEPAEEGVSVLVEASNRGSQIRVKPGYVVPEKLPEIDEGSRTWTDLQKRTIEGTLVSADEKTIVVRMKKKQARIPLAKLSKDDREYVSLWLKTQATKTAATTDPPPKGPIPSKPNDPEQGGVVSAPLEALVPRSTGPIQAFAVETGEKEAGAYAYTTPHFKFISDRPLTTRLVNGFSVLYEATYEAVKNLPWGARLDPGKGREHFVVKLFSKESDYLKAGGMPGSAGTAVGPLSLVQIRYLGVRDTGRRLILEDIKANQVLIHELTHALRDHVDRGLPIWAVEGSADYVASAPYHPSGKYDFSKRMEAAVNYLAKQRAIQRSFTFPMGMEKFLGLSRTEFYQAEQGVGEGAIVHYAAALLTYSWFWHGDRGADGQGEPGAPIRKWLEAMKTEEDERRVRHILLDGRTHAEIEKQMQADYRRLLTIKFR